MTKTNKDDGKVSASFQLKASFKAKDEEGNKVILSFDSEGETVKELLDSVAFPKGINALVTVRVSKGIKVLERSLAPHKARTMLEDKDVTTFENVFRGL